MPLVDDGDLDFGTVARIPTELVDASDSERLIDSRRLGWGSKQFRSDILQIEVHHISCLDLITFGKINMEM